MWCNKMSSDIVVKTTLGEDLIKGDCLYTESDEWIKLEGNLVVFGVTDYAQKKLRYIVNVELPEVGKEVKAKETLVVLESVKTIADAYSPINGKVVEVNESLYDSPDLINKDPYGEGWLVKLQPSEEVNREAFLTPEKYAEKIKQAEQ